MDTKAKYPYRYVRFNCLGCARELRLNHRYFRDNRGYCEPCLKRLRHLEAIDRICPEVTQHLALFGTSLQGISLKERWPNSKPGAMVSYVTYTCGCGREGAKYLEDLTRGQPPLCRRCGVGYRGDKPKLVHSYHLSKPKKVSAKTPSSGSKSRTSKGFKNSWYSDVIRAFGSKCAITGKTDVPLSAHHIWPWAQYRDLQNSVENGFCMSRDLHKLYHSLYRPNEVVYDTLVDFYFKETGGRLLSDDWPNLLSEP